MADPYRDILPAFDRVNFWPGNTIQGAYQENTTNAVDFSMSSSYPVPVNATLTITGYANITPSQTTFPVSFRASTADLDLPSATVKFGLAVPDAAGHYTPDTTQAGWTLEYRIDYIDPATGLPSIRYGTQGGLIYTAAQWAQLNVATVTTPTASDPVTKVQPAVHVQPGPEEITPLVFPAVSVSAGSNTDLSFNVPTRPTINLHEDTYSYAFIDLPMWAEMYISSGQSTLRYDIHSTDALDAVANLVGSIPSNGGWIRERWKNEFGYVRIPDTQVGFQLLAGNDDVCAYNPNFANVDLFGVENASQPVAAAYTRIAYTLYGLASYTLQQHSDIVDECGGAGYFKINLDGTYALDPVAYPQITAWYNPFPSRFRLLGGGKIIRGVPQIMQDAYASYWANWSNSNTDFTGDPFFIDHGAPSVDFARGKLYRISQSQATYVYYQTFTPNLAPSIDVTPGTYTVTIRTTSNVTGNYYDSPWVITVTPKGGGGGGGVLTTTQSISNITLRQGVSARPFTPVAAVGGTPPYTFTVTTPSLPADIQINPVNGEIYGAPAALQGSTAYTVTVNDSNFGSRTRTLNIAVVPRDSIILAEDYNYIQRKIDDIVGVNPDGWGYPSHYAAPVTNRNRVTRAQWRNIISDVNVIQTHITNAGTSTQTPVTGTVITSDLHMTIAGDIDWLHDDSRRYTCHPAQFANSGVPNVLYGTSTRIAIWSRSIEHKVRVDWPTNLLARYFFNQGSQFVWRPYYLSGLGNDRDGVWANFITYLQDHGDYKYTRSDFIRPEATTVTTYTSGTLSVSIVATRRDDITSTKRIDFSAKFENTDVNDLIIDPTHGYWNYGPWEAFVTDTTSTHISSSVSALDYNNAQSGFSLDKLSGVIMLYMGAWPNQYASCDPEWLAFSNLGINKLGNNEHSNSYRYSNGFTPYWTMGGEYNLSSIPIGTTVQYQIPRAPFTKVPYTYSITRVNANSVHVSTYTAPWDTGNAGNNTTIRNWWRVTNELWGYTPAVPPTYDPNTGDMITPGSPAVLGVGTFSW